MATKRITDLVSIDIPGTGDVFPIVDKSSSPFITKQVTLNNAVGASTFSTKRIFALFDPTGGNAANSVSPTEQIVIQNPNGATDPRRVSIQNIYPRPIDSSTISLTFNNNNRSLQAAVRLGSINQTHIDPALAFTPTGGGTDRVFYENNQTVTTNYTITQNYNAMSTGPVTLLNNVTVTIPTGSTWAIIF
jgi:hypothetical protein